MSIRWIKTVLIEGEPGTLEIFLGNKKISDKCYIRISGGEEKWFKPRSDIRDVVIEQGIGILKTQLSGKKVTKLSGGEFLWQP